jgi:hypothetical protein
MTTTSPRCAGCETFVKRLFDPAPLHDERITMHRNFAELSKCATELCDLCKLMRRQFYYHSADYVSYNHTDQRLQDDLNSVCVFVSTPKRANSEELCDVTKRSWQFYHGNLPGPSSRSHNISVKDRTPVPHVLGNDISLENLLTLSRQWLTSCVVDHKKCGSRTSGGSSYLPRRLLDVGLPGQPSIQLVLSEDLPKSQKSDYITLSYCWGLAKYAACTTKANLIERLRAIPTSSLPKTLADAVEIVRALRVKYLWIDALCIIQATEGEESDDWEEEFPSMGKTYQHSLCTIAASGAEHSGVGRFYRREAGSWPVQNYFLADERRELGKDNPVIIEAKLPNWNISVENSALAKRGWLLQERILAPRAFFWTEDGLFWNCSERNA